MSIISKSNDNIGDTPFKLQSFVDAIQEVINDNTALVLNSMRIMAGVVHKEFLE